MARVRLEPFGKGRIYPHEETLSGPKADRLKLFHATDMNLSPIFGLYPDEDGEVQATARRRRRPAACRSRRPIISASSAGSGRSPISTSSAPSRGLLGPKPIFIADGHHRYETALRYLEEKQQAGEVTSPDAPGELRADDARQHARPGPGDPADASPRLRRRRADGRRSCRRLLGDAFRGRDGRHGPQAAREAWELIETDGSQELLGFGTVADGVWQTGRFRSPAADGPAGRRPQRRLARPGGRVLQRVVLDKLLPDAGKSSRSASTCIC